MSPTGRLVACNTGIRYSNMPSFDLTAGQGYPVAFTPRVPSPHRSRLLATSAELFWTHGYRATTTRQIAATLGLQQATLYHHVASKEDLLYEICSASLSQLLCAAEEARAAETEPGAALETIIRTSIQELLANQREHATMIFELRGLSRERQTDVLDALDRYRQILRTTIANGQAAGTLRSDIDARYLEQGLFSLLTWMLLWHRPGEALTPDLLADLVIEIYLHGSASNRGAVAAPQTDHAETLPFSQPAKSDAVRTAERLYSVSAALFRSQGYDATTAREIASVLGIQKASLYHHTRGKAHLLHQVCTTALHQIRTDVQTATAGVDDGLERARRLVVAHVTSLLEHQDQHATSLLETRALSGEHRSDVNLLHDAHQSLVRSVLESSQNDGALRADIPAKYLSLLLFSLTNRSMLWYRPGGALRPDQLGAMFAALFLSGAAASRYANKTLRGTSPAPSAN